MRVSAAIRRNSPVAALAVLTYLPLLLTAPGRVGADTKSYLYLEPGRLLGRAVSMWDPDVGLGTVTHQNIGYLWPMGPWFWLFETLGAPDWVAQRLWLATILFAAGAGVWALLRELGWGTLPAAVSTFAYAFTPYTLTLASRISVILLPFAGLPWLVLFAVRAVRRGGWRDPALFALVVLTIGGVNATALLLVGLAPALWLVHAAWISREASVRQVVAAGARMGALTVVTSLWWIAGLVVQGAYGIEILRYTETAETVAAASTAPEVLRSLGYWFFYGGDRLGPWIQAGADYTQRLWLIGITYALPVLALAGAAVVRWRHRAYFALLILAGTFLAVGAFPWDDPSIAGRGWKALLLSDAGLAMRSSPRAVPLLALGMAVFLGCGVKAVGQWAPKVARPAGAAALVLAVAGLPPLWTGQLVSANLDRPEELPGWWSEAARHLDAGDHATRVLELPGSDFASYRWGETVDPITPGLIDRSFVARELIPYGSAPSADVLIALDRRLQENVFEPSLMAPMARLLAVGDVVVRNDIQFERYRLARPYVVAPAVLRAPGLGEAQGFGPPGLVEAVPQAPMIDELALAADPRSTPLPPVQVVPVEQPVPVVRVKAAGAPVILAGDGEGVVAAAAAGVLAGDELIRYAASLEPRERASLPEGATVVLTDSNRRRGRRWSTVRDNAGYTERAGEIPLRRDLSDNRLPVFGSVLGDPDDQTVTVTSGGVTARATSYGNPVTFTPEYRASSAVDGDPHTVWRTGPGRDVRGERLVLEFDPPVTTGSVRLAQLAPGLANRSITEVELVADGASVATATLTEQSQTPEGQTVTFPERTIERLDVVIRGDSSGRADRWLRPARWLGVDSVGFAEIDVAGRQVDEVLRLPVSTPAPIDRPLTVLLERARSDPAEVVRRDEESALARTFQLGAGRVFSLSGTARLSASVPGEVVDRMVDPTDRRTIRTSRRLPGSLAARGSAALDGDPSTAWVTAFGAGDDWLEVQVPEQVTVDRLELKVVADGRHSLPRQLTVWADGVLVTSVDVPSVREQPDRPAADAVATVPVDLPVPATGRTLRFEVTDVEERTTPEWFSSAPVRLPVGIAELGVPSITRPAPGGAFDSGCRDDLLTVDGTPVAVRVTGSVAAALARDGLRLASCTSPVAIGAGNPVIRAAQGGGTGLDIDRLVLQSGAGGFGHPGGTARAVQLTGAGSPEPPEGVAVRVAERGRTGYAVRVDGARAGEPFWLVLGQSHNAGWELSASGARAGDVQLVDGYANGWLITPAGDGPVLLDARWTPQRLVWAALFASAAGAALCLALAAWPRRRRAGRPPAEEVVAVAPHEPVGATVRWPSTAVVAAALGLAGLILVGPVPGVLAASLTAGALRSRWGRALLAAATAGGLAVSAAYVLARQALAQPAPAFEWPGELAAMHQVAWFSVLGLVALVAVDGARGMAANHRTSPQRPPAPAGDTATARRRDRVQP